METLHAELKPKAASQPGEGAGLRLVFKGGGLKHLLGSGRKQPSGPWRQGGSEQQDGDWPSPVEAAALTDSPGRPFSPSSAEASPGVPPRAPGGPAAGPRSVHGHPPGKVPYPDDRTPEAEAARAQSQPPAAGAAEAAAAAAAAGAAAAGAAGQAQPAAGIEPGGPPAAAGPRSVHGQPPGKGVHPDDPAFRGPVPTGPEGACSQQPPPHSPGAAEGSGGEAEGGGPSGSAGPRSVYGQPPGKNAAQIQQIAAASTHVDEEEEEEPLSPLSAGGPLHAGPWSQPQQAAAAAGPGQGYAPGQATSGHGARQRSAPPTSAGGGAPAAEQPPSRKRPASQAAGDTGQRKRAANGAVGGGEGQLGAAGSSLQRLPTAVSSSHSGVPASLVRSSSFHGGQGPAGSVQQIRPMPGAPRSLQQRQQLVNGVAASTAGAPRQPAGAPRARQPPAPSKPKQPAKPSGSGQRRPSSAQGAAAAAAAAAAHQYKPGDIVWAKIGVYPWWPAQLQRPTADEHFKPKHASTDLFCVFYGTNDYNWLPPNQIKPFIESHPDYQRHAAVKNKALQRAIDEAWVYGMQRQRPDQNWTGARFVA